MTIFPKNSVRSSGTRDFEPSAVVMYESDGHPILATILGFKKNKYSLLNQRGHEIELSADRLYPIQCKVPPAASTANEQAKYLTDLGRQAERASNEIKIDEIWKQVQSEDREMTCAELFKLTGMQSGAISHAAMRLALIHDRIFFKRKKEAFTPRPEHVVEELKRAEIARLEKERLRVVTASVFAKRVAGDTSPFPEDILANIHLLEDLAAETQLEEKSIKEGKELVQTVSDELKLELHGSLHQRAFRLLIIAKHFERNVNLSLIRHKPPLRFSKAALAEADEFSTQALIDGLVLDAKVARVNLTDLPTLTIDDDRTRDMDDALSVERVRGGYNLYVHISDVSSAIRPDSVLDKEALKRSTSLYLPELTINMLPEILSEERLSLLLGEPRACVTYKIEIDSAFNPGKVEIIPSVVKVSRRLNYDEANRLLESGDEELELLHNIAATCEMNRLSDGGTKIHKRDVLPLLTENSVVKLEEVDEESPARSLISEMMVLVNRVSAQFAVRNGIPLIFRTQEYPDGDMERFASDLPEGPARDYAIRVNLKKSLSSLSAATHATLGLDAYCQATSPIRRFADLCNQRQILSFVIRNKSFYSHDELRRLLEECDEALAKTNLVTRETKRLWLLRYLHERAKKTPQISGTIVRTNLKHPLVELEEIYLITPVRLKEPTQLGQARKLRIVGIDPEFDEIRLEEAI